MTDNFFNTAIKAALEAGDIIMKIYDTPFDVELKNDLSPLTEADKQANHIINSYLIPTGIPIISEENKQIDYSTRKQWSTCWVVDPVDGTKEFIKRNGEFTVNIALVDDQTPIFGVIYVPATKTLYFGDVAKQKAFKINLNSHFTPLQEIMASAKPIHASVPDTNILRLVGSRSHMNEDTLEFMGKMQSKDKNIEIVSKGSSLKFCLLAEGKADIYPRFAPTMEWDTAAGQAICNAVGISVISKETNESLLYNKENLLNPWFIAFHNEG